MKQANIITHVGFEDLDNLAPVLVNAGYNLNYFDATQDSLDEKSFEMADLVIILGGPIGVYQSNLFPYLDNEIAIARSRIQNKRPLLGICLGSQIIASAMGSKVYPGNAGKEIGWGRLSLTEAGASGILNALDVKAQPVLHWHGDTFDLPTGATLLASTERYTNQVFSVESYCLAFQCHIEVSAKGLERWYVGHLSELMAYDPNIIQTIRSDSLKFAPGLNEIGSEIIAGWLRQLN